MLSCRYELCNFLIYINLFRRLKRPSFDKSALLHPKCAFYSRFSYRLPLCCALKVLKFPQNNNTHIIITVKVTDFGIKLSQFKILSQLLALVVSRFNHTCGLLVPLYKVESTSSSYIKI